MRVRAGLTPLAGSNVVDDARIASLRGIGVTTVEELLGAVQADPTGVGSLLGMNEDQIQELGARAAATVPPNHRQVLTSPVTRRYPLGARIPTDKEEG